MSRHRKLPVTLPPGYNVSFSNAPDKIEVGEQTDLEFLARVLPTHPLVRMVIHSNEEFGVDMAKLSDYLGSHERYSALNGLDLSDVELMTAYFSAVSHEVKLIKSSQ